MNYLDISKFSIGAFLIIFLAFIILQTKDKKDIPKIMWIGLAVICFPLTLIIISYRYIVNTIRKRKRNKASKELETLLINRLNTGSITINGYDDDDLRNFIQLFDSLELKTDFGLESWDLQAIFSSIVKKLLSNGIIVKKSIGNGSVIIAK